MLRIVLTVPIWAPLFLISQLFGGTKTKIGSVTLNLGLITMGFTDLLLDMAPRRKKR